MFMTLGGWYVMGELLADCELAVTCGSRRQQRMRLNQRMVAVLVLGSAIAGCSSDSTNNTGGGTTGSTTSTGAGGGSAGNECKRTMCLDELALTDMMCNSILATACANVYRAYVACSLAHDSCLADGTQDGSKVATSCFMESDAIGMCFSRIADGGTD
jgi:hypothetical protein